MTTTKVKVSDLTGAQLDWAVATALGHKARVMHDHCGILDWNKPGTLVNGHRFEPCKDWSQGGQIIEREKIIILPPWPNAIGWYACIDESFESVYCHYDIEQSGDTPLIAAMRAFVASKLGDEVEVPEVQS